MTEPRRRRRGAASRTAAATATSPEAAPASAASSTAALDQRLATLHLRLGNLALARAELEHLDRLGRLDTPGLADLADVRWRTGDLEPAAAAAARHLGRGGNRRIALVVAAEAAAAQGRPVEARAHVDAVGAIDGQVLERLFAGMPRRAHWPSAPNAAIEPPETLFEADRRGRGRLADRTAHRASAGAGSALVALPDRAETETARLWGDDDAPPAFATGGADRAAPDPVAELARARDELDAGATSRAVARLALILRVDPTLAPSVLDLLGRHRELDALLVRGDACRLLGRHHDADAAYAAAAAQLDEVAPPA